MVCDSGENSAKNDDPNKKITSNRLRLPQSNPIRFFMSAMLSGWGHYCKN